MKTPDLAFASIAALAALASLLLLTLPATAQTLPAGAGAIPSPPAQLMSLSGIPAVALSYRGQRLATITRQDMKVVLTIEDVDGSDQQPVAIPDGCQPTAIRWARRWDLLAVLTQCAADAAHPKPTGAAWVMDAHAGKPLRKIADFDGTASELQWRSDGKVVAFLYTPATQAGSGTRHASVIVAGPINGGKLSSVSPAGLDIHKFYLSPVGGLLYTATAVASPTAPPALYEVVAGKTTLLLDPATAEGPLHGLRIDRLRWSRSRSLFFLGRPASAAPPGADLYMKLASATSPVTNLTASVQTKPEWFEPSGNAAIATRVVSGSTEVMGYRAFANGAGLWRSNDLCTIPGTITDGHGPGSMATNARRYAYFEYPKAGGSALLKVGDFRVGMVCKPRWTIDLASATRNVRSRH